MKNTNCSDWDIKYFAESLFSILILIWGIYKVLPYFFGGEADIVGLFALIAGLISFSVAEIKLHFRILYRKLDKNAE